MGLKPPPCAGEKKGKEKKRKEKEEKKERKIMKSAEMKSEISGPVPAGTKPRPLRQEKGRGRGLTSGTSSQECVYVVVTHPIVGMSKNLSAKNGLSAKGEKRRGEGKKRENAWSGDQT